jgi:hypothetical protein
MREGLPIAFSAILILVSTILPCASLSLNIIKPRDNPLGIWFDPAPSPEDGPPLSAGALRDKAYLPAEIGGIVGAYAFITTSLLLALLLVGRRLRRERELAAEEKLADVEMIAGPYPSHPYYPSPLSPTSGLSGNINFSWPSPEKNDPNPYVFPSTTRSPTSPASDHRVDTRVVQADREHLQRDLEDIYALVMEQEEAKAAGMNITDLPAPNPLPSASPQRTNPPSTFSKRLGKPNPISTSGPEKEKSHSRTSSIISSLRSPRRKASAGIRSLRISSPIPTPLSSTFPTTYASDEEPLSPRNYAPPPPPPIPRDQVPYQHHSRNNSSTNTATATAEPSPISPARSIAENLAFTSSAPANNRMIGTSRLPNLTIPTAPTSAPHPQLVPSAGNSTRTLPFRAFDPPAGLASPSFSQHSSATKTTVLERTTPLSPGLKTPWSAGAMPYSPYQPFTPLMPVTPRLVTREDRKRMKRLEPKSPTVEMVQSSGDLWDAGY